MRANVLLVISIVAVLAAGVFIVVDEHSDENVRGVMVSYTVKFDGNGGTPTEYTKTVTPGEPYGQMPYAFDDHGIFQGWFTDPESGTEVTKDTIFEGNSGTTLYAHWIPKYKITYEMFYSWAENDERNRDWYNRDTGTFKLYPAKLPATQFNGWYIDREYTMGPFDEIDSTSWRGDVTFYAKW